MCPLLEGWGSYLKKKGFAPSYFRNEIRSGAKLKQEEEMEKKGKGCSEGFQ